MQVYCFLVPLFEFRVFAHTKVTMSKPKVLMTNAGIPEVAFNLLKSECELIVNERLPYPSRDEILKSVTGVDGIFWTGKLKLDKEVIEKAGPQLKMVATMSAGYDNIDVNELKARKIPLSNTADVLTDSVAEVAILLTIAASRRLHEGRQNIDNGTWQYGLQWMLGRDLADSTVGIVGFGRIGEAVAKRLISFNVNQILYTGPREKPAAKHYNAKYLPLKDLVMESDVIILTAPLNDQTRNMFNKTTFSYTKKKPVLVNVGRGELVNTDDLIEALKDGTLFAAGLDVTVPEPLPVGHPLLALPNCVILPHLGSATLKTRSKMAELAAKNMLRGLKGEPLLTPVYNL